jgi:uncharacterized membrane protein
VLPVFPLGLLCTSVLWDAAYLTTGHAVWARIGFWSIIGGLVSGVVAEIVCIFECQSLPPDGHLRRLGREYRWVSVVAMALFAISAGLRGAEGYRHPLPKAMAPGWFGVVCAVVAVWLLWRLVSGLPDEADI